MDIATASKQEFINQLLKFMVTPNVKESKHSDVDDAKYKNFIKAINAGKDVTESLPLDFAIKNEMFNLIKADKVFIESSVKFTTLFTTKRPTVEKNTFVARYIGNEFYYSFLDNHPGIINVDKLKDIPADFEGLMAVPSTVLEYKNMINFNIHRVLYTPKHNGKFIYPRVVVSNKFIAA